MNIFQELEDMRKRIMQEINTEFDVVIEHLSKDLNKNPYEHIQPYEMKYPLTAGPGIFKGKKPTSVIIGEKIIQIRTWKQLVEDIIQLRKNIKNNLKALPEKCQEKNVFYLQKLETE